MCFICWGIINKSVGRICFSDIYSLFHFILNFSLHSNSNQFFILVYSLSVRYSKKLLLKNIIILNN